MDKKTFVELIGASNESIDQALEKALKKNKKANANNYEIIETKSSIEKNKTKYQVKIKACLEEA